MRDPSLTVNEGIVEGMEELCVVIEEIPSGGEVGCELYVTLRPQEGTASMCLCCW